jgi:hypothetical protein
VASEDGASVCEAGLPIRTVRSGIYKGANAPYALGLLRARRERRCRRAAEKCDEGAAVHSITSSARATKIGGTSTPRAFAVLRLMTRENLLGRSIGKSPALAPFRMRSM